MLNISNIDTFNLQYQYFMSIFFIFRYKHIDIYRQHLFIDNRNIELWTVYKVHFKSWIFKIEIKLKVNLK